MSDHEFEEFLQREAQAYNAPPANIPRDEMWTAIAAARRQGATADRGAASPAGVTPAASRTPRTPRTPRTRWSARAPWIGMAATLVVGVAIGRYAFIEREGVRAPAAGGANVNGAATTTPLAVVPRLDAGGAAPTTTSRPERVAAVGATERATPARGARDANGTVTPADFAATAQHMARAEALLVAYTTTTSTDTIAERQLGRWAKDVLLNTRLLMDSPAGRDPLRRALLKDLESVLVQLVQRSPAAGAAEERAQIQRSLDRTNVVPRLRSAVPVSLISGT